MDHLVWSVLGSPILGFQCPLKYTGERFFNLLCCIFSCCCLCLIGDLHRICTLYRKLKKSLHLNKQFPCLALTGLFSFSSFLISVSVSVSAQDGIVALGKAHTRSAPSLSSLPKVALETVPIFVWLNTDRFRPCRVECRLLPFSTPLSFRQSVL